MDIPRELLLSGIALLVGLLSVAVGLLGRAPRGVPNPGAAFGVAVVVAVGLYWVVVRAW